MAEGFTCEVEEQYRSACKDLPKYPGTSYCVLHEPDEGKNKEAFEEAKKSKIVQKDYDFRGAIFPEGTSNFDEREFDADANFSGASFIEANFRGAKFSKGANFREAHFSGEKTDFREAYFSGERTNFTEAQLGGKRTLFTSAQFSSAYTSFESATFTAKTVRFSMATFTAKADFWGIGKNLVFCPQAWVWFDSHIENPELLTFNNVLLRPGWFINNADVRKVHFTNVKWCGMPDGIPEGTLDEEIQALKDRHVESPHYLLAQACRRLSANAEENREYPLANEFHYWSMDALRKEGWRRLGLIGYLYWMLSGYGERPRRAFLVLVGMGTLFAVLYLMVAGSTEHIGQAFLYSLAAMVRLTGVPAMAPLTKQLQPSEPGLFQVLVTFEGILGPLQIALLALAIRRKVMR